MLLIHPVSADDELDDYVNNQHEKIFSFLKENAEMLSQNNRIDLIEKEFSGLISINEISKRVMGKKYFMSATEEQRKRFNNKFKETFFNTYSSALSNLEDQKIEVIGHAHPKDKPNAAIVRVRITSGEDSYDLNYQMIKKKNKTCSFLFLTCGACFSHGHQGARRRSQEAKDLREPQGAPRSSGPVCWTLLDPTGKSYTPKIVNWSRPTRAMKPFPNKKSPTKTGTELSEKQ